MSRLKLQPATEMVHRFLRTLARAAAAPIVAGVGAGERGGERVVRVDVDRLECHGAPGERGRV
jgi:hypothetical protein|tara:strand:- start:39 stop:227 length:189 start_codon:yes stop_codon:yes gene_type:complete